VAAEGPEQERDLAVAEARRLVLKSAKLPPEAWVPWLRALDRAVARSANDTEAEELRAQVLLQLGRPSEALPAFEKVVRRWPRRRTALLGAALAANQSDRLRPALGYWKRAVEVAPYNASVRGSYAARLMNEGEWAEARAHLEAARRFGPFDVHARHLLARLLLHEGKKAEAGAEMEVIRRLRPPDLAELERLFRESEGP
jgi:tetratricopeptide (TPR) repeat protein